MKSIVKVNERGLICCISFLQVCIPFACLYSAQFLISLSLSGVEQSRLEFSYRNARPGDSIIVVINGLDYVEQNRVRDAFERQAPEIAFQFLPKSELEFVLRDKQADDVHNYNEKILAGIEMDFAQRNIKIMFSGNFFHGTPKTYNLVTNVLLMLHVPGSSSPAVVETWTKPILKRTEEISRSHVYIYESLLPMGLFLYILFFASDPFNDISTQFKSLFCLSAKIYWIVSLVFDLCVHAIFVTVLTCVSYYASIIDLFDFETYGE